MSSARETWDARRLLFVYGSLLRSTGDPAVDAALSRVRSLGRGHIPARLYDLGDYPGAIPAGSAGSAEPAKPAGSSAPTGRSGQASGAPPPRVFGLLLGIDDPGPFFEVLDGYEGFDSARPHAGEFIRSTTEVTLAEPARTLVSQVYFYNFDTRGRPPIPSGDYLAYLRERSRDRP